MIIQSELGEYQDALREHVCSRCIERRPGAPPCGPFGKECGIERHVRELVEICRKTNSALMDPYIEQLHDIVCANCESKDTSSCPCPLDYLMLLAVEAVEKVQCCQSAC
jgi:hypothetical protein